jgi:hypothetical protein
MRYPFRLASSALALTAALGTAPSAGAQRVDPGRVIDVSMDLGTQTLSAAIREGGSFKLVLHDRDQYEIVPVVLDAAKRRVTIAVYRGLKDQPSTRGLVERVELTVGTPARLRSNREISLVVDGIRAAPRPAEAPRRPVSFRISDVVRAAVQGDQCCVCCGGVCACACGVKMSCGSCCMPGCCDSGPLKPSTSLDPAARYATFIGTGCGGAFPASAPARTVVASR